MPNNRVSQGRIDDGTGFQYSERHRDNMCIYSIMLMISRSFTLIGKTYTPMDSGTQKIDKFCEKYSKYECKAKSQKE